MAAENLILQIRASTIGDNQAMWGPYGARRITYADYSASGRALAFIEQFIAKEVLPFYANTHSEASGTARQTTKFREDARAIIHNEVSAGRDASVIFCGTGVTAAIHKMVGILQLRVPDHIPVDIAPDQRPIVFVGPYEHHSNYVMWRETIADVVVIAEDAQGKIDLADLEAQLVKYNSRPLRFGSFSAASNVTGILTDVHAVAALLKRFGALAMFDYAASGSHVRISLGQADALFLSPHKFIGGVGTPGILVIRNNLLSRNRAPVIPGGGTVTFVSDTAHDYLHNPTEREEGGTPAIIESIRAGLVFQLKGTVGIDVIEEREQRFLKRALEAWGQNPFIKILGNKQVKRTSIVSFLVRSPHSRDPGTPRSSRLKRYLHHNFITALLNDVFGIQVRGGCSCAGPYGHRLLNVGERLSAQFRHVVTSEGHHGIKPGWTRVTFSYFMSEVVFQYILQAVDMVATEGWKLLPEYNFNPTTGLWKSRFTVRPPLSLASMTYDSRGHMVYESQSYTMPESVLSSHLKDAETIFASVSTKASLPSSDSYPASPNGTHDIAISPAFEKLRWFDLPRECLKSQT